MKTEPEFPGIYQDFLRNQGVPHTLRRDNAWSEKSAEVRRINQENLIADGWSEPHHPHQNPVELNGIKYLKDHAAVLMERVGAPKNLWLLAFQYICEVSNNMADPTNDWKIPNEIARGETVDISHLLTFYFYQPVLYLDPTEKFPNSKEKPGWFVGFSDNIGDTMTFRILMSDKKTVIVRSVVRPAKDKYRRNRNVNFDKETDEEIATIDAGTVEDHVTPPRRNIVEIDDDPEEPRIAERTRSKTDDSEITTRTRSQDVMNAMVTKSSSAKFFNTFNVRKTSPNDKMTDEEVDTIAQSLGKDERRSFNSKVKHMKGNSLNQVNYVNTMDINQESLTDSRDFAEEENDKMWEINQIERHRVIKKKKGVRIELKCRWKDLNKSAS